MQIVSPMRMIQRMAIALAQVKAGDSSENLLNEIRCIFFVSRKKNYEKVLNNMMNSVKL